MEKRNKKLLVGISPFPPLVMKRDNNYVGFEIDLWKKIAKELRLDFSYLEYGFTDIVPALTENKIDVALGGIAMTEEREKIIDFSHSIFDSGLRLIVSNKIRPSISGVVKGLFKKEVFNALIVLLIFIFISANIIWLAEKNSNGRLSGPYIPAIFNSLWWGITTIATIGYGDYTPITLLGRLLAAMIILTGITVFSVYIVQFSSIVTLSKLKTSISNNKDIKGKKVATLSGSTSEKVLKEMDAFPVLTSNIEESYEKLSKNEVQAVLYDEPALIYYMSKEGKNNFEFVGDVLQKQSYAIALKPKSKLREKINRIILKIQETGEYELLRKKWLRE